MEDPSASVTRNTSRTIVRRTPRTASGRKNARWPYLILSLIFGIVLWIGIDMKRMQDSSLVVELGVEQILPAGWRTTSLSSDTVTMTIRGTKQSTSAISQDTLMVQPNLPKEAFDGDVFEGTIGITSLQVRGLPPGVQVLDITPATVTVRFDKVVTRYLTVTPGDIVGEPEPGFILGKVGKPEPQDLPITGPKALLDNISPGDVIRTTPIDVTGKKGNVTEWVKPLPFTKNGVTIDVGGTISVPVDLVEAPVEKTLERPIDVKALIDSPFDKYSDLTLTPPSVVVTVSGTQSAVESLNPNEIVVYADIRERLQAAPGEYNMRCRFLAPARIQVVRVEPDTVKWITKDTAGHPERETPAE